MSVRVIPADGQVPVLVQYGQGLLDDPVACGHLVAGTAVGNEAGDPSLLEFGVTPGPCP